MCFTLSGAFSYARTDSPTGRPYLQSRCFTADTQCCIQRDFCRGNECQMLPYPTAAELARDIIANTHYHNYRYVHNL